MRIMLLNGTKGHHDAHKGRIFQSDMPIQICSKDLNKAGKVISHEQILQQKSNNSFVTNRSCQIVSLDGST